MKVQIKKDGGLAIDCRTNVYFKVDDVFSVGDQRFSEENLTELVGLGYADEIAEDDTGSEVEEVLEEDTELDEDTEEGSEIESEEKPKYQSFTKKADLKKYAKETYSIDLDKELTLKGMIEQLENELGGEL